MTKSTIVFPLLCFIISFLISINNGLIYQVSCIIGSLCCFGCTAILAYIEELRKFNEKFTLRYAVLHNDNEVQEQPIQISVEIFGLVATWIFLTIIGCVISLIISFIFK